VGDEFLVQFCFDSERKNVPGVCKFMSWLLLSSTPKHMEQPNWEIILKIAGLITMIAFAFVAGNTLRKVDLGAFGSDNESKRKVAMKLVANIFIFLCLGLILIGGLFKIFNDQVTLLLFIAGLGALGIKLVFDLKQ
jgi:hypothetical protein